MPTVADSSTVPLEVSIGRDSRSTTTSASSVSSTIVGAPLTMARNSSPPMRAATARSPRPARSSSADVDEHVVADAVAPGVVDRLEAVEVDVEHAGGPVLHLDLEAVEGDRPVGEARERVGLGGRHEAASVPRGPGTPARGWPADRGPPGGARSAARCSHRRKMTSTGVGSCSRARSPARTSSSGSRRPAQRSAPARGMSSQRTTTASILDDVPPRRVGVDAVASMASSTSGARIADQGAHGALVVPQRRSTV